MNSFLTNISVFCSLAGNLFGDKAREKVEPLRKKKRLRPVTISVEKQPKKQLKEQQQQHVIEDAFEHAQQVRLKRIEFKLAANIAASVAQRSAQHYRQSGVPPDEEDLEEEMTSETRGFGVFEPAKDGEIIETAEEEELPGAGAEFVSLEEMKMNRMTEEGENDHSILKMIGVINVTDFAFSCHWSGYPFSLPHTSFLMLKIAPIASPLKLFFILLFITSCAMPYLQS